MLSRLAAVVIVLLLTCLSYGQSSSSFTDSIRIQYHIPELAYAVVSSDSLLAMDIKGVKKINASYAADTSDRFRIGSNTKAITGFIAAELVKSKKINWHTKFFDLFPELKPASNKAYHHVTLLELLTFRTRLFPYTYTSDEPGIHQFSGSEAEQRYQFIQWFFKHTPVKGKGIHFSNLGYVAAGLMLEKASGRSYKELVTELGRRLEIDFSFGNPNENDSMQPWGHDYELRPEPPCNNVKLGWLLAAGNINVSLPGYLKFIQLQLKGLRGKSFLLSEEEFNFLHYGFATFSVGWFNQTDTSGITCSYNVGNPGTFLTKVFVYKDQDRAYILFANVQSEDADKGLDVLYTSLRRKWNGE